MTAGRGFHLGFSRLIEMFFKAGRYRQMLSVIEGTI